MRRAFRLRCLLGACCIGLLLPAPARAEERPAVAAPADALYVSLALESTALTPASIEAALERELGVPVAVSREPRSKGLSITVRGRRATLSFSHEVGGTTTRSLDLSGNEARQLEVLAFLAGNLARDEASELLALLAPPAPPPAESASAAPPSDPATKPEPAAAATKPVPKLQEKAEEAAEPKPTEPKPAAASAPEDDLIREDLALNLSLYHPVTLLSETERRLLHVEGGLAYSRVGAIEGFGLTLGYLRVERHLSGFSTTLGWNRVDGDTRGVQLSVIGTEGHGRLRGYEGSALVSVRFGDVEGAQTAVAWARAENVTGIQASSGVALSRDVLGLQTAVGLGLAQDVTGGQVALVSIARDLSGAQASLVGVARDVQGAQLSLVNVGHKVEGGQVSLVNVAEEADLQLGLVNIAERVDGAALGLVSIAGNGRIQPFVSEGWLGPDLSFNAGVRFVAGFGFSQLSVGHYHEENTLRVEGGGGVRFEREQVFGEVDLAGELGAHFSEGFGDDAAGTTTVNVERLHYRPSLHVRFFDPVWLMAGVELSHEIEDPERRNVGGFAGLSLF